MVVQAATEQVVLAPPRSARVAPSLGTVLILGYAFLLPIQIGGATHLRLAVSDLLMGGYTLLRLPALRRVRGAWTPWHIAIAVLIWTGLIGALLGGYALDRGAVLDKSVGILVLLVSYACLVDYARSVARIRLLLQAFVLGALLQAVLSLAALAANNLAGLVVPAVNDPYPTSRLSGLLLDPNAFGGLLATALVLHLATVGTRMALLSGATARIAEIALPFALALTFSRSAWIGLVLGLVTLGVLRPAGGRRALRRLALTVTIGLPVLLINTSGSGSLASRPGQVNDRLVIGRDALHDLQVNPVTGIGLGVFEKLHGLIVHNTALWFLTELGIVGLFVFAGLMVSQVRRGLTSRRIGNRDEQVLATALLAGFFTCLGLSVGIEAFYQRYWWLIFAGLGALYAEQRRARA